MKIISNIQYEKYEYTINRLLKDLKIACNKKNKAELELSRLQETLHEIKCLIHKAINEREINGVGELNLTRLLFLLDEEGVSNEE